MRIPSTPSSPRSFFRANAGLSCPSIFPAERAQENILCAVFWKDLKKSFPIPSSRRVLLTLCMERAAGSSSHSLALEEMEASPDQDGSGSSCPNMHVDSLRLKTHQKHCKLGGLVTSHSPILLVPCLPLSGNSCLMSRFPCNSCQTGSHVCFPLVIHIPV